MPSDGMCASAVMPFSLSCTCMKRQPWIIPAASPRAMTSAASPKLGAIVTRFGLISFQTLTTSASCVLRHHRSRCPGR